VTITPEIGAQTPDENLYFKRLSDPISRTQTLSPEQDRYAVLDYNFPAGVETIRDTNNIVKGVARAIRLEGMATSTLASTPKSSDLNGETFSALSDQEKSDQVKSLFDSAVETKQPISLIIKVSVLAELLKNPLGLILWEQIIASERSNHVVLIRDTDEILDATLGIRARIDRVDGENITLDEILKTYFS